MVKGHTQKEGIDYDETFSPVMRFASIHLILAIVAYVDLELFQIDVKTAFLNGGLDKEITWINLLDLFSKEKNKRFVNLKDLFMVSSNHLGSGTDFMRL